MKKNQGIMLLILFCILFMSIGYANISSTLLNIQGNVFVKATNDLIITDAILFDGKNYSETNSKVLVYNKLMFKSIVQLNDSDSYVTFKITIYNNGNRDFVYENTVFDNTNIDNYTNNNIKYTVSGIDNSTKIKPKEYASFNIRFEYLDKDNITNKELTSCLKFIFNKGASVMEKKLINEFFPDGNEENIVNINDLSETDRKNMFADVEVSSGGIYKTLGITGKDVYVFRGVIDNNYVNLGGYLWRIMQIDENGNLRLILNETTNNDSYYNEKYEVDSIDNIRDILDYNNSNVKKALDSWYEYIKKIYSDRIVTSSFCQNYDYKEYKNENTNTDVAYFNSYLNVGSATAIYSPSLICDSNYIIDSNIGLVSAEELVLAGASFDKENTKFFLYNPEVNSSSYRNYFWTISPSFYDFTRKNGGVFMMGYNGKLIDWIGGLGNNLLGVRPVITIDGNYEMTGNGTKDNPYIYEDYRYTNAKIVDITDYDQLDNKKFFIANVFGKFNRNGAISKDISGIGLYGIDTIIASQNKKIITNVSAEPIIFSNKTLISDTESDGYKYQIKSSDGKYLKINDDCSVEFTDVETYLKVIINMDLPNKESTDKTNYIGRVIISNLDETMYLNFYGAASSPVKNLFAGWNELDKNAFMNMYEIME